MRIIFFSQMRLRIVCGSIQTEYGPDTDGEEKTNSDLDMINIIREGLYYR